MRMLVKFLFHNLKGLRGLVLLAMMITVLQVSSDIFAAFPLKFIPSKVQNNGNDPMCLFPFLDPIESWFDIPQLDPSLQPDPNLPPNPPPEAQCPVDPNDVHAKIVLVSHSTIGVIVFSVLMLVVFGLLSALLAFLDLFLAAYIGQQVTARLRNQLFDHLQRLSLDWHGRQKKGDLVQRITGNITDIEKLVTDGLVDLLAGVLTLVGVISVMLFLSPQYTLISLAVVPALFMMVLGYTRNIKFAAKRAAHTIGQVAHIATEDINALILIKVFTREGLEARRFGNYVEKNRRERLRAGWLQAQFTPLVALLVVLGTATVLGVGGYVANGYAFKVGPISIAAESVDVGTLILFLTFLKLLYQPMRDLSKLATLASTAASGAERIQEVYDQAPEVKESPVPGSYSGPQRFQGEITFENVVMGYLPEAPVLRGIDMHISPGTRVGLVGLSGGGKTTLVKLITRFYDIQQGTIKIDGLDNRLYPLDVLRNNVSIVLQDSVLFAGTIAENIAFGRPGASIAEIIEAAKKAYIHETIIRLPHGYDTHVSEQGENFSGGQKQRLSIARAILRDAPILILDEPTAALDVEAEAEVMRALNALIAGRTVLTISHRLSTLGKVDEIIVINEGRIAERGTFKELKRAGGLFTKLLDEQNQYNLDFDEEETLVLRSVHLKTSARAAKSAKMTSVPSAIKSTSSEVTVVTPAINLSKDKTPIHTPSVAVLSHENGPTSNPKISQKIFEEPVKAIIHIQVDGKSAGTYELQKKHMMIGRRSQCDIPISSPRISRFHAALRWGEGVWVIEDAESLNGLTCEGRRIHQLALSDGDRIYLDPSVVLQYIEEA